VGPSNSILHHEIRHKNSWAQKRYTALQENEQLQKSNRHRNIDIMYSKPYSHLHA